MPSVRAHGFEQPLDGRQVGSWFAFGFFLAAFFVLYAPIHTDAAGIALTSLYTVSALATFYTAWKAMRTDPSDQGALAKRTGTMIVEPAAAAAERKNYCSHCEAYVKQRSKHCRRCNKCVETFDHHCPWLNTCVGANNYRYFMSLLVSLCVLTALQAATAVQAAVLHSDEANNDELRERLGLSASAYVTLLSLSAFLCFVTWLSIMQLFTFHLGLISRGMTTFEFIIAQRQKQKAFEQANGKAPLTFGQKQQQWIQNNAPCFAVCDVCDMAPAPGTSTRGMANVQVNATSRRPRPGLLRRTRSSAPKDSGSKGPACAPKDQAASCSLGAAGHGQSNDVPTEPAAVHITAPGAVPAAEAPFIVKAERDAQCGRVQLAPISAAPTLPSSFDIDAKLSGTRELASQ